MVTTYEMQKTSQAKNYLAKEDYYQKDSEKGYFFSNSNKLLEHLGLSNNLETTMELHHKLIDGFNPKDDSKLVANAGAENKRSGIDFVSSAPKSFSLLNEYARIKGDTELENFLISIQKEANLRMMQEASKYALIRLSDEKRTKIDNIDLMWGSFNHNTSRASSEGFIDPQEHTHNFIYNFAGYTDENGEYKTFSIEATKMMRMQKYLGNYYRNELAKLLIENGIEVELKDAKDGTFEIAGFSQEQIDTFSNRSKEVRGDALKLIEEGKLNPNINLQKAIEIARLKNYKAKKEVDRNELTKDNAVRFEHAGLNDEFFSNLIDESNPKEITEDLKMEFLKKSYVYLSESKGIFTLEDLKMEFAKQTVHYGVSLDEVDVLITKDEEIVKLAPNKYTSQNLINLEKFVIKNLHNKVFNIDDSKELVDSYLTRNNIKLTEGQSNAVDLVLKSNNQFIGIQGDAGSGKTFSMKVIQNLYGKDFDIVGLAPTGKAGENLGNDAGIQSKTIDSYLFKEFDRNGKPRIILLDETGMVDSIKLSKLMESVIANGDKLVMIGDTKQYMSVGAGKIFEDCQKFGIEKVDVTENKRQQTQELVDTVDAIKNGNVEKAFDILKGNPKDRDTLHNLVDEAEKKVEENFKNKVVEKKSEKKLLGKIVDDYTEDSIILAPMNKQRTELNKLVREKRISNGKLDLSNELEIATFTNAKPNGAEKYNAKAYEIGQVVAINSTEIKGFKAGQKFKVLGIKDDETLILDTISNAEVKKDRSRKALEFNIKDNIDSVSVYNNDTENPMKIAINEKIIFTKRIMDSNNKKLALTQNGSMGMVKKIDGDNLTVELDNKKTVTINAKENPYFDYAYAITDYKSQGMSIKKIQVLGDSMMANLNALYVQITRAKQEVSFYTKNLEEFIEKAKKSQFKESTLDYTTKENFRALEKRETKEFKKDLLEYVKNDREKIKFNLKEGIKNGKSNDGNVIKNESKVRELGKTKQPINKLDVGTRQKLDKFISTISVAIRGIRGWRESINETVTRNWNKYSRSEGNIAGNETIKNLQKINSVNKDLDKKSKLLESIKADLQDKRDILEVYRDVFKGNKLTQKQIMDKILDDIEALSKKLEESKDEIKITENKKTPKKEVLEVKNKPAKQILQDKKKELKDEDKSIEKSSKDVSIKKEVAEQSKEPNKKRSKKFRK